MKKNITKISLLLMMIYVFLNPFANVLASSSVSKGTKNTSPKITAYESKDDIGTENNFWSVDAVRINPTLPIYQFTVLNETPEYSGEKNLTFGYWQSVDDDGNALNTGEYKPGETYTISKDLTLLPVWVERTIGEYTVNFVLNGGVTSANDQDEVFKEKTVVSGASLVIPQAELGEPGFNFEGWYLDESLTDGPVESGLSITENMTLYAKWELAPKEDTKVTITFDLGRGVSVEGFPQSIVVEKGAEFDGGNHMPRRAGHEFLGWYEKADFSGLPISNRNRLTVEEDITLYAKWEVKKYTVDFNLNGGTSDPDFVKQTVEHGNVVEVPATIPTKLGHTFVGWDVNEGLITSPDFVKPGDSLVVTSNVTLVAQWEEGFTISFELGEAIDENNIFNDVVIDQDGSFIIPSEKPVRVGYNFLGWLDNDDRLWQPGSKVEDITESLTLTAKWDRVEDLKVTLHLNDGTNTEFRSESVMYNDSFTIPKQTPTREGYRFLGWQLNDTEGPLFAPGQVLTNITTEQNLLAVWQENEYTVLFNLNGGTGDFPTMTVKLGGSVTLPTEVPEHTKLSFLGWDDGKGEYLLQSKDVIKDVTSDIVLTAKWGHIITFDLNYGTDLGFYSAKTVQHGETFIVPTGVTPEKPGYVFLGWYYVSNGTNVPVGSTIENVVSDMTLHAKWIAENYAVRVTFNLDGGQGSDDFADVVLEWHSNFNIPTVTPEKAGYEFTGWLADPSVGELLQPGDKLIYIEKDTVLTAQWEVEKHTIEFDLKDGTDPDGVFTSKEVEHGKDFKIPTNIPSYEGNIFRGWYYVDNGLSVPVQAGETIVAVKNDITLYANWLAENYAVRVTFDLDGGLESDDFADVVLEWHSNFNIPTVTPEKAGYEFTGWLANPSVGELLQPGDKLIYIEKDTVLTAQWEKETESITHTVKLLTSIDLTAEGGVVFHKYEVKDGDSFTIPEDAVPTREGYEFAGWYNNALFNGDPVTIIENVTKDVTLYAKWEKETESIMHTVKLLTSIDFTAEGGVVFRKYEVKDGDSFTIPEDAVPTREGYEFAGWYNNALFNGESVTIIESVTKDITLYAKWEATTTEPVSYTVKFELNGGTGEGFGTATVTAGDDFTIPMEIPTKSGYNFAGWYDNVKLTGTPVNMPGVPTAPIAVNGNLTFYAKWEETTTEPVSYTVKFELNGGTGENFGTATVAAGDDFTIPMEIPIKSGYNFAGWYDNVKLTGTPVNMPGVPTAPIAVNGNLTFYAKWEATTTEPVSYTVKFELNGGTGENFGTATVAAGDDFTIPMEIPTKSGYNFAGWYDNVKLTGTPVNMPGVPTAPIAVNGNLTLYAKWEATTTEPVSYTVKFELNGGTGEGFGTATVVAGDDFTIPTSILTKDGYKFVGWYLDEDLTNKASTTITNINSNVTLYAKWEKVNTPDLGVDKYRVRFDLNGGTGNFADMLITKGASVVKPTAVPTKAGYKFVGWFTAKEGGKEVSFPLTVDKDTVLYAQWVKDGGTNTTLNNNGNANNPSTGDMSTTSQNLFLALFILSLAGAVGISVYKKKQR